jgi:phage/plasmid-like protein (TIGR03299 family)
MSAETIEWLQQNTLIGFTDKRGAAWHGREADDNHFAGAVPRDEALRLLSYPVESGAVTVTILTADGVLSIEAPDRQAIVRVDTQTVLGLFKMGYKMHQPREWLLEALEILLDGALEIGSVVVLKGGAVAAVQVELPETRIAQGGRGAEPVAHRPFLTAATSFDGSLATTYGVGTQVVVCDNTLAVALRSFDSVQKIRHTSQSLNRVGEIRQNLGLIVEQVGDAFDDQVRTLTEQYVTDARFAEIVAAYTGVEKAKEGRSKTIATNKQTALLDLWRRDERVAPWKNSAYGVLAAFNTADHHVFGAEKSRVERNQMKAITGDRDQFDSNVLRLLATV